MVTQTNQIYVYMQIVRGRLGEIYVYIALQASQTIMLSTKLDKQNEQISSEDTICIHPIDCTVTNHIFSRLLEMIRLKNERLLFFKKPIILNKKVF